MRIENKPQVGKPINWRYLEVDFQNTLLHALFTNFLSLDDFLYVYFLLSYLFEYIADFHLLNAYVKSRKTRDSRFE